MAAFVLLAPATASADQIAFHILTDHMLVTEDAFWGDSDDPNRFQDNTGLGVEWRLLDHYYAGAFFLNGSEYGTYQRIPLGVTQSDYGFTGGYRYTVLPSVLNDTVTARGGLLLALHGTTLSANPGNELKQYKTVYSPRAALNGGLVFSTPHNKSRVRGELATDVRFEAPIKPTFEPLGTLDAGWFSFNISFGMAFDFENPPESKSEPTPPTTEFFAPPAPPEVQPAPAPVSAPTTATDTTK